MCRSAEHGSVAASIKIEIHYWNLQSKRLGLCALRMARSFSSPPFSLFSLLFQTDLRDIHLGFPVVGLLPVWNTLCYYFLSPGTLYILLCLILWWKVSVSLEKTEVHWVAAKWWHQGSDSTSDLDACGFSRTQWRCLRQVCCAELAGPVSQGPRRCATCT